MTALLAATARSQWRIAARFDSTFAGITTPGTYTITRADGVGTTASVTFAFTTDTLAVDLATSEGLLPGVVYVLAASGVSGAAQFSYIAAPSQPLGAVAVDDPEAEAFGVDIDWLADGLDPSGDAPAIRGRQCLLNDLAAIAQTVPGELFHRPTDGAGMPARVNGPTDLDAVAAAIRRQWSRDPRVQKSDVTVTADTAGNVTATCAVTPVALPEPLPVRV